MTKLRQQMIDQMVLRGFAANTQRAYLHAVSQLARHYDRSPDRISKRERAAGVGDQGGGDAALGAARENKRAIGVR